MVPKYIERAFFTTTCLTSSSTPLPITWCKFFLATVRHWPSSVFITLLPLNAATHSVRSCLVLLRLLSKNMTPNSEVLLTKHLLTLGTQFRSVVRCSCSRRNTVFANLACRNTKFTVVASICHLSGRNMDFNSSPLKGQLLWFSCFHRPLGILYVAWACKRLSFLRPPPVISKPAAANGQKNDTSSNCAPGDETCTARALLGIPTRVVGVGA